MGKRKTIRTIEDCDRTPYSEIIQALIHFNKPATFKEIREYLQRRIGKEDHPYTMIKADTSTGTITETKMVRKGFKITPSTLHYAVTRMAQLNILEKTKRTLRNRGYKISDKTKNKWEFSSMLKRIEETPGDRIQLIDGGVGDGSLLWFFMGYKETELNPEEKTEIDRALSQIIHGMKTIKEVIDQKGDKRMVQLIATIYPSFKGG